MPLVYGDVQKAAKDLINNDYSYVLYLLFILRSSFLFLQSFHIFSFDLDNPQSLDLLHHNDGGNNDDVNVY